MTRVRILVIKHGALGDMVQATGAFQAIRQHHVEADITLLTSAPYVSIMQQSPSFNQVYIDHKPSLLGISGILTLRRWLINNNFKMIYDLQNSDRTGWYFRLLWPWQPAWSGYVWGCSHPHRTDHRGQLHTLERLAEQLALAGISHVPEPSLDWLPDSALRLPPSPYALLFIGGAAHRPAKRWHEEGWYALSVWLAGQGITPVFAGTSAEADSIARVAGRLPEAVNLCHKTTLVDLVTLARHARLAVGNDTGPMHVAAVAGCASLVLYSSASNPKRCGQRGRKVVIEQVDDLQHLDANRVMALIQQEFSPL